MSFLKRLFSREPKPYTDERGIYFHVECRRCKNVLRLRADRQYDLNQLEEGGYEWRKTIVCDKCFSKMPADVQFDAGYRIISQEVEGGRYLTADEIAARNVAAADDAAGG